MARDRFLYVVRKALEKDGWKITADPYVINIDDVDFEIDLAAEELLGAEKQGQKIAVEIKSFISPSNVSEFHTALGQYLNYCQALEEQESNRIVYLAVPIETYQDFFQLVRVDAWYYPGHLSFRSVRTRFRVHGS